MSQSSKHGLEQLFENNKAWVESTLKNDPHFFDGLSHQQAPEYLWIGCSDSRVPANQITGLMPGEVFVHRNIANIVAHSDLNCLSVLQFAVEVLKVKHIIVCGHYGCGGVAAAMRGLRVGLADNWLRHVVDVREKHSRYLGDLIDREQINRLCELNVQEQVINVCESNVIQDAWANGQHITVHSLIYGISDGLIRDLGLHINHLDALLQAKKSLSTAQPT
jgi:carbonic anhydrase